MSKRWNRIETWLALVAAAVGLLLIAVAGLWIYVSATATPLHPNAQDVPSAALSPPPSKWTDAAEHGRQIVRAQLAEHNLPGVSVAVGVGGEIVWAEGFGFANIESRAKVTPDTRFRIGTASTALTSAAAGLLLEKGLLDLDEPIQKHVPDYPEKQWPVTLRQVMGHLAGLSNDGGDEGPLFEPRCARPVEALPYFSGRSLRFEPGTDYRVSNFGWILVSAAIEAAADEPFLIFMRKHIFEPLGMDATEVDSENPDRATPYFPRFASDPRYGPDVMRDLNLSCYSGSSAFVSTPSDLVRFGIAIKSGTLLQPATVQLLQTSQRTSAGQETGYGLGWDIETVTLGRQQIRAVGHDGDVLGGMLASFITLPDHDIVVAITSNTSYADTFGLASKIAAAFAERKK